MTITSERRHSLANAVTKREVKMRMLITMMVVAVLLQGCWKPFVYMLGAPLAVGVYKMLECDGGKAQCNLQGATVKKSANSRSDL